MVSCFLVMSSKMVSRFHVKLPSHTAAIEDDLAAAISTKCHFVLTSYSRYHLKDVIVGKIYFLLVRIKLKYMELAIVKKEMAGTGTGTTTNMAVCTTSYEASIPLVPRSWCSPTNFVFLVYLRETVDVF